MQRHQIKATHFRYDTDSASEVVQNRGVTLQKNMKTVPGYCHTEGLVLSLVSIWTEASARNLSNTSPKSLLTANP